MQLFLQFWTLTPYEFFLAVEGYRERQLDDLKNRSLNTVYIVNTIRGALSKNAPMLTVDQMLSLDEKEESAPMSFTSYKQKHEYLRQQEILKIKERYRALEEGE